MKPIIEAVPKELIERELTEERLLRATNNAGNFIYTIKAAEAPDIMREIGRLRELAFRQAGGGTGNEVDVDEQDLAPDGYTQLFVWDPVAREILGGYRYIICDSPYPKNLSTEHYFRFSDRFRQEVLPYTIELGRSFVQPRYQRTRDAKSLYALDNLWDGLGALTVVYPNLKYFFGKMTMYPSYPHECRNMILYFLDKYFHDNDRLVYPLHPLDARIDEDKMRHIFTGSTFREDYKILNSHIRSHGINIPPLVNSYMNLSPKMLVLGTAINDEFGDVEETGIFFAISDIYEDKKMRHIRTFYHRFIEYRQELVRRMRDYSRNRK